MRWTEADLARIRGAARGGGGPRRPAPGVSASAEVLHEAGQTFVRFTVPFRATPMKQLYGGRAAWQAEWGETQRWERVLGGGKRTIGLVLALPVHVRAAIHATGPRKLTLVRSYRGLELDPTNRDSIAKPIEDALIRLHWLIGDRATQLLGGATDVQQQQDARAWTTLTLGPIDLGRGPR